MLKKTYSNEEVSKKYDSLPEEVKNLLYSFEMTSVITKVGEKNGLHIDQMDTLNTETGYVMMGLTETKDFPALLAQDLQLDPTKAQLVAKDIEEMLFSKIRDAMKQTVTPPAPIINDSASKPPLSSVLPAAPASVALEILPKIEKVEAKPEIKLEVKPSDIMLSQPTVAKTPEVAIKTAPTTPATPPKPQEYKADPYRESVN